MSLGLLVALSLVAACGLFLQPLESIAPVVDMCGVGFEERITTEFGDYFHPRYNADRSAVPLPTRRPST